MKKSLCLVMSSILMVLTVGVIPIYAANKVPVTEEMVIGNGMKSHEVAVSELDSNKSVCIDTYVYKEPTSMMLRNGDVVNDIYIVKRVFPTSSFEDFPYQDHTLSIYGKIRVTVNEITDSYGPYKKIKSVEGSWSTSDNQVSITQQHIDVIQHGQNQQGTRFEGDADQDYGSATSWLFDSPMALWPYIHDVDMSIFWVTLSVTVKDLVSGDTWSTGTSANV